MYTLSNGLKYQPNSYKWSGHRWQLVPWFTIREELSWDTDLIMLRVSCGCPEKICCWTSKCDFVPLHVKPLWYAVGQAKSFESHVQSSHYFSILEGHGRVRPFCIFVPGHQWLKCYDSLSVSLFVKSLKSSSEYLRRQASYGAGFLSSASLFMSALIRIWRYIRWQDAHSHWVWRCCCCGRVVESSHTEGGRARKRRTVLVTDYCGALSHPNRRALSSSLPRNKLKR